MSTFQLKKMLTSADPRPVAERTVVTPGISFIASSMGRVMVAIISSAGMTPLSTRTTTRGKLVCGKTEEGTVNAEYMLAIQRARLMKIIETVCRVANVANAFFIFLL